MLKKNPTEVQPCNGESAGAEVNTMLPSGGSAEPRWQVNEWAQGCCLHQQPQAEITPDVVTWAVVPCIQEWLFYDACRQSWTLSLIVWNVYEQRVRRPKWLSGHRQIDYLICICNWESKNTQQQNNCICCFIVCIDKFLACYFDSFSKNENLNVWTMNHSSFNWCTMTIHDIVPPDYTFRLSKLHLSSILAQTYYHAIKFSPKEGYLGWNIPTFKTMQKQ